MADTSLAKRFYKAVTTVCGPAGWSVKLDARSLRTPAKAALIAPTEALAELIAEEWRRQGEAIRPDQMPATRLAFTTIDGISAARAAVAADIARKADADHLCYFAPAPQVLSERQALRWVPILDWANDDLGLELHRVVGITHRDQPAATLERVEALALAMDDFRLAGLAMAAGLFGSVVLALALERGQLDGAAAFELSRLDESFQEEQWGVDAEAAVRTENLRDEALMLEQWFLALQ